jgi:hypothetical protein
MAKGNGWLEERERQLSTVSVRGPRTQLLAHLGYEHMLVNVLPGPPYPNT